MGQGKNRIWEIDFLRGIAIILMSLFHLLYDLSEFYNFDIDYTAGIVDFIGATSALMFITLTGISSSLSSNNLRRGLKILFFAYLITLISYFFVPNTYINFGILHLIGFSIVLYSLFKRFRTLVLIFLGLLIIILGNVIDNITSSTNLFTPFGLTSATYASLDYYPLLPYFGVFLLGMALKNIFYLKKQSLFNFSLPSNNPISLLGQHSLLIYLIHQPIILAVLFFMHKVGLL
ncbi:MAG: hypothetical protein VR72_13390 [Clostridiaceae bacterium BRH_c20a]|nr:MAG: hypothetical protein VR72_13390 [Clostridiaceae bacterium BRH_c20a]